ncbi:MFS transporter [Brevibacterium aurantiacum]|uniref:MFS transporter n=1 Tax=Brevibacterium aurantiacum TaxID=273384 RepID=UPI0018668D29|nr:MFS transporter [Brevibacterium aurantiacum]
MSSRTRSIERPTRSRQSKKSRNALLGATFGFFTDMYDIYLPVIALAPAMVYFEPAGASIQETAIFAGLIFTASIIGRPLGSLIFGPIGDRYGRRKTTLIAAAGAAICTGSMCFMPGYETLGMLSIVLLIALRLLDGVFLGGEYSAANPLAMEHAPAERRGMYGALINVGFPLSLVFITLVTMSTLALFPAGDVTASYSMWGWRIPFFIGFILTSALFFLYLRAVPESDLWAKKKDGSAGMRNLFTREVVRVFLLACVTMTGVWFTMNGSIGVFATHFKGLGVETSTVNSIMLTAAVISAVLFPAIGHLSQILGRRRIILLIGLVILTFGAGGSLVSVASLGAPMMSVCAVITIVSGFSIWATVTAYLIELFPTRLRSTGYGVAYSLPSIIPAFYAYYMVWLSDLIPFKYTPTIIIAVGAVLIILGSASIRDTRHVDLAEV